MATVRILKWEWMCRHHVPNHTLMSLQELKNIRIWVWLESVTTNLGKFQPALAKCSVGRAVKSVTHCVCSAERGTAPMYLSKFGVSRDARKKNGTQLVGELLLDGMQELSPNIRYPKCQWFQGGSRHFPF